MALAIIISSRLHNAKKGVRTFFSAKKKSLCVAKVTYTEPLVALVTTVDSFPSNFTTRSVGVIFLATFKMTLPLRVMPAVMAKKKKRF